MQTIENLLNLLLEQRGTDLYLTVAAPPSYRVGEQIVAHPGTASLTTEDIERYLSDLLLPEQLDEFQSTHEFNTAIDWHGKARFRINVYRQQSQSALVIRRIEMDIPTIEALGLPEVYGELALMKRGLVLLSGPTGAGKSTSLAAMVGHRNSHGTGHIITVEDPLEFIHRHGSCIVTQRDVGLDTYSYAIALKNALRQRPDMVVIGEIRDREVMEQALYFAETSHLCLATIHANNASQAIERVLNFFPEEKHQQVLLNLSLNLRAVLSQRLVPNVDGGVSLVTEVMLNKGYIRQLIVEGKVRELREMIEKSSSDGMHSFDQRLVALWRAGRVSEEVAMAEADSPANMRMLMSQQRGSDLAKTSRSAMLRQNPSDF